MNGAPPKTMDTMVAYEGFANDPAFFQTGHIEVFYFTREYGIARWEVWRPLSQNPVQTKNCAISGPRTLEGNSFVVTQCADWSKVATASTPIIPVVPLPNINLLQHAPFDKGGGYLSASDTKPYLWHRVGMSSAGYLINWGLAYSTSTRDIVNSPIGVAYLKVNCGSGNHHVCPGSSVQMIYQDIPISAFISGQSYGYGIQGRINPLFTKDLTGTIQITLQELDANNTVLWQDGTQGTLTADNGPDQTPQQPLSVYLSSGFIDKVVQIPILPAAVKIRYSFTPLSWQEFQLLDAWFAPYPSPTGTLAPVSVAPSDRSLKEA